MIPPSADDIGSVSAEIARQIDAICDRYEESLVNGGSRTLEDSLNEVEPAVRPVLLRQLLLLEWELLADRDQAVVLDGYLLRFPAHKALIHAVAEEHADGQAAQVANSEPEVTTQEVVPSQSHWQRLGIEVHCELGRGGMGVVYLATEIATQQPITIKLLRGGRGDSVADVARFRREAETLARLNHPHVVAVQNVGEFAGQPYFTMEYCTGGSLADFLQRGPLTARESATLIELLARAVHAAHEADVIHRDLKPTNVLLQSAPREAQTGDPDTLAENPTVGDLGSLAGRSVLDYVPKLGDFGLARSFQTGVETQSDVLLGTPQYMSPEQVRGEQRAVGPATDIHALGVLLFECLVGRPPYGGSSLLETMMQVVSADPAPLRQFDPEIPRDLEAICLKCLRKSPVERFATAAELADDLHRFVEGRRTVTRRPGMLTRTRLWIRRAPVRAVLVVALMLASIALLVAVGWIIHDRMAIQTAAEDSIEEQSLLANKLRATVRQSARARYLLALQLARNQSPELGVTQLAETLSLAESNGDSTLASSVRRQLQAWHLGLRPIRNVFVHPHPAESSAADNQIMALAISPDGRHLLTGSSDHTAQLWDIATGKAAGPPFVHRDTVFAVAFSPDGRSVITASADATAQIWDVETSQPVGVPLRHDNRVLGVAFSPIGNLVATASHDKTARIWDTETGNLVGSPLVHRDFVRAVAFSPDGTRLLTGCSDRTARYWNVSTGQAAGPPLMHDGTVYAVAISADGRRLLTGCSNSEAQLWNTAGEREGLPLRHDNSVMSVAFSPDGHTILTASSDCSIRFWDATTLQPNAPPLWHPDEVRAAAFSPDGRFAFAGCFDSAVRQWGLDQPVLRLTHSAAIEAVAWSGDAKKIAIGDWDGRLRLWNSATGELLSPPLQLTDTVRTLAFHPSGRTVAAGCADGTVQQCDAETLEPTLPAIHHLGQVRCLAYSPDGRLLATTSDDKTARLWVANTGEPLTGPLLHPREVWAVAFSPDCRTIATGCRDNLLRLWDVATSQPVGIPLNHERAVTSVCFSPDGQTILSASWSGTLREWDPLTHTIRRVQSPNQGPARAATFSTDGRSAIIVCDNHAVQLWDLIDGQPLGPLLWHPNLTTLARFAPDGTRFITSCHDGVARCWELGEMPAENSQRIRDWARAVTGIDIDDNGNAYFLDAASFQSLNERYSRVGP